jgi:hypothetical protein
MYSSCALQAPSIPYLIITIFGETFSGTRFSNISATIVCFLWWQRRLISVQEVYIKICDSGYVMWMRNVATAIKLLVKTRRVCLWITRIKISGLGMEICTNIYGLKAGLRWLDNRLGVSLESCLVHQQTEWRAPQKSAVAFAKPTLPSSKTLWCINNRAISRSHGSNTKIIMSLLQYNAAIQQRLARSSGKT